MSKLKVHVVATDSSDALRFRVHALNLTVNHAFGSDARYKGRNEESYLEIEPINLAFHVKAPNGSDFDGVSPASVLAAILGPVVQGCEIVVSEALEREREAKEEERKNLLTKKAKPI